MFCESVLVEQRHRASGSGSSAVKTCFLISLTESTCTEASREVLETVLRRRRPFRFQFAQEQAHQHSVEAGAAHLGEFV